MDAHYCCHENCLLHSTSFLILALKIQHLDFHSARSTTGSTLTYKIPMNKRSSWTSACLLNTGKLLGERYQKLCQSIILQIAMHSFIFRKSIWKKRTKQLVNSLFQSAVIKGNPQSTTSVTNLPILRHISKAPLNSENSYFDTM